MGILKKMLQCPNPSPTHKSRPYLCARQNSFGFVHRTGGNPLFVVPSFGVEYRRPSVIRDRTIVLGARGLNVRIIVFRDFRTSLLRRDGRDRVREKGRMRQGVNGDARERSVECET